jgi:antitoxin (DNA-binding transcriptional repressor) of toxin-antitoxin stability system
MKAIGIRELKAHLSRVLRDVATGEAYLVTDRGRVIAELRRPGAEALSASDDDRAISRLAAAGALRLAERPRHAYQPSPIKSKATGLAKSLLDADRGE